VSIERLTVFERADFGIVANAAAQDFPPRALAQIVPRAKPRMVAVRVRDHGMLDRLPRIDIKAAGRAKQPAVGSLEQGIRHAEL
jgi:hypothetical protein